MSQSQLKRYKKTLHKTAQKEKENIISDYVAKNWEQVIVSSIRIIRRFNLKTRFKIAMTIIFKPDKQKKRQNAKKCHRYKARQRQVPHKI